MQNLKFVALRYIGILSLHYPHTSGLPGDAGISPRPRRPGVVAGNPSVTRLAIDDCSCSQYWLSSSTFFHPNFWGVPVAPDRPCWGQPSHRP